MDEVEQFLHHFKLPQYYLAIKAAGADRLSDLQELNDEEALEVARDAKLKTIHRKKFVKAIQSLRNGSYQPNNHTSKTPLVKTNSIAREKEKKKNRKCSHGTIAKYSQKGFGFISMYDGSRDVFFHRSQVKSRSKSDPVRGQKVEFQIVSQSDGRTQAINVYIVDNELSDKPLDFKRCNVNQIKQWLQSNTKQNISQTFYVSLPGNIIIIKTILTRKDNTQYTDDIYNFVGQQALLHPSPLYENIFKDKIEEFYVKIQRELCQLFNKTLCYHASAKYQMIILNIFIKYFTLIPREMTSITVWDVVVQYIQNQYTNNENITLLLNKLNSLLNNSATEIEEKKANDIDDEIVEIKQEEIENINDFLDINVLPNTFTEFIIEPNKLPIISKEKGYISSKHLLRTHTFLMREDLIFSLRKGVKEEIVNIGIKNKKLKRKNLSIRKYFQVSIDDFFENKQSELTYHISFKHRAIKWQYSKKLIYGSLVLLLNMKQLENINNENNENDEINIDMIWCTVAEREIKYLEKKRPAIALQLRKGNILTEHINGKPEFIMFESSDAYFLPYEHVINALKKLGNSVNRIQQNNILPFENILISIQNNIQLPSYLTNDTQWDFKCILNEPINEIIEPMHDFGIFFSSFNLSHNSYSFNVVKEWPKNLKTSLDNSQLLALKHILTNQVAIIQGPPGTGKTYLALKALNILLKNLNSNKKILVAALTNHALDQLLCGILQFEDNIIRIGSRSQCEELTHKSMRSLKKEYLWRGSYSDYIKDRFHELRKEKEEILDVLNNLYGELNCGFNEELERKYKIIPMVKYYGMKGNFNKWTNKRHQIDNQLFSLSRQFNSQYEYEYKDNQYYNNYVNQNATYNINSHNQKYQAKIKWKKKGDSNNNNGNNINAYYAEEYYDPHNNQGWQVVGAKKRKKKAQKITEIFDNYYIGNLFELYVNEPHFMEKINVRKYEMQRKMKRKQFAAMGLKKESIQLNMKHFDKTKPMSTTEFITLSQIPNIIEEVKIEEEKKEDEKKDEKDEEDDDDDENEIELMMQDRQYLDNLFDNLNDSNNEIISKYKQIDHLNKMIKKNWNYLKIKNTQQKNRLEEMKQYENDLENKIKEKINEQLSQLRTINREIKDMNTLVETKLIKDCRVIGITTTAAARLMDVINEVKPDILMFEEAAEILESHIITSLNPNLEHLILIGDHKQLRPNAATYKLITENNLEISLFERLILSGIDHRLLNVQRRMIPQICELSSFHYDDEEFKIKNHESTIDRDDIKGISKNVIFFNHSHQEEQDENIQSKYNIFEAKMIIELTIYLLKQEYKSSNITILTLYRGQQLKIKSLARKNSQLQNLLRQYNYKHDTDNNNKSHNYLNIKCVDKYQGEENDIILLSLVRSNKRNSIGFLSIDNRICVALSRAKNGLYVFGNFDLYSKVCNSWKTITNIAIKNKYLQNKIEIKCKRHSNIINIEKPIDFANSPEGGCSNKCDERMDCGHVCPRLCHSYDHKYIKCLKPCTTFHDICKHKCQKKCFEECGKCEVIVTKGLPGCGHIIGVKCYKDIYLVNCPKLITKTFNNCRHIKEICCYQRDELIECNEIIDIEFKHCEHEIKNIKCKNKLDKKYEKCKHICDQQLESCGHYCSEICDKCFENNNKHKCGFKCNRSLVCGHQCDRIHSCKLQCPPCDKDCENECPHSKCHKKCGELCVVCNEKCTRSCIHHKCTNLCSEECNFIRCNKQCNQILECGYLCPGVCGEECLSFCKEKECVIHNDFLNDTEIIEVFDEDWMPKKIFECSKESQFIKLSDCGHIIERTAIDKYVSDYRYNNSTKIQLIPCPLCKIPIRKCKRYINIINNILTDIQYVKKQIINNQFEVAKRNIVSAMLPELGNSKGHWFKCENGHYYVVGECGGPMEKTKCIECDSIIGGQNHKIVNGSQLATEMDGAQQPKWTTALQ